MPIVATGIGLDEDKAKQNAFCNAIEQAIGVLVDAETLVENDDLLLDRVLTFSRGYVEDFKIIRQWQDGGAHHVRILARVSPSKLRGKLEAHDIPVREVPGERIAMQIRHDLENETKADEMLWKAMSDFGPHKLLRVQIVGDLEVVERSESRAKLQIKVMLSADLKKWEQFREQIVPLLNKIGVNFISYSLPMQLRHSDCCGLENGDSGVRCAFSDPKPEILWALPRNNTTEQAQADAPKFDELHVLRSARLASQPEYNNSGWIVGRMQWEGFKVPKGVVSSLKEHDARDYRLRIALLDARKEVIKSTTTESFRGVTYRPRISNIWATTDFGPESSRTWRLAPFMSAPNGFVAVWGLTETIEVELDQLDRVENVTAHVEPIVGD